MSFTTFDSYIAAPKQKIQYTKIAARTTVAAGWFSLIEIAGQPGAGTLAGSSLTPGVIPTDATAGFPIINAFGGAAKGAISLIQFANTLPGRLQLVDRLWIAGAFGFAAGTSTITGFPSVSARMPGGTDYTGNEIWLEVVTAFLTGNAWSATISYTNQSGTAGRTGSTPGGLNAASMTLGRMWQFTLQAGDTGVQSIQSITVTNGGTAMTAGTFNLLLLRPLWSGRVNAVNDGNTHDMAKTGLVEVFTDSALQLMVSMDGTSSGSPDLLIEIANA